MIKNLFNLTKTELEVLDLMSKGLDNDEISKIRNVSWTTTKSQVLIIYSKLGVYNENNYKGRGAVLRLKAVLIYLKEKGFLKYE